MTQLRPLSIVCFVMCLVASAGTVRDGREYDYIPPPYDAATLLAAKELMRACFDQQRRGVACVCSTSPEEYLQRFGGRSVEVRCLTAACRFSALKNVVSRSRGNRAWCTSQLMEHARTHSVWRNLDFFDRFKMTMMYAERHAGRHDPNGGTPDWTRQKSALMTCIAARETGGQFEPLIFSYASCGGQSVSQAGLGAQQRALFDKAVKEGTMIDRQNAVFRSSLARYQRSDDFRNYDNFTSDPELQMEFMSYVLSLKRFEGGIPILFAGNEGSMRQLALRYNGSSTREQYTAAVGQCASCINRMRGRNYGESEARGCVRLAISEGRISKSEASVDSTRASSRPRTLPLGRSQPSAVGRQRSSK